MGGGPKADKRLSGGKAKLGVIEKGVKETEGCPVLARGWRHAGRERHVTEVKPEQSHLLHGPGRG